MENPLPHKFKPLPRSTPADEAVSQVYIDSFERALERGDIIPRGYMLLRNAKVVAERYWPPYSPENKVWVYSLSKSFAATAIGFAVDEGLLSLEDRVVDFFVEKAPAEPSENLIKMHVHHLLSMNTGHASEPIPPLEKALFIDWVEYFLNYQVEHEPGSHFLYNSMATFMLSAILQKISNLTLLEFLRPRLLEPLGFDETLWDSNPQGINTGGWGLMLRLEDTAKLGQLYLDDGVYEGKRILSSEWIRTATSLQSRNNRPGEPPDWCQGYGYQFWLSRHGAYRADGAFGQYCVVMPEQNMVLALMSETPNMQDVLNDVWENLLRAPHDRQPALENKLDAMHFRLSTGDGAKNLSGVEGLHFTFEKDSLTIEFISEEGSISLLGGRGYWQTGELAFPAGRSSLWSASAVPMIVLSQRAVKTAAWFEWQDDHTLCVNWAYVETPHRRSAEFRFDEAGVTLHLFPASFEKQGKAIDVSFLVE